MLIISKEGVQNLREKLLNSEEIEQCKDELKRMLDIKEASLWRAADGGCCCCAVDNLSARLSWEVQLLEEALKAVEEKDHVKAAAILVDYAAQWN